MTKKIKWKNLKTPFTRYSKEEIKEMEKKYFSMVKNGVPPSNKKLNKEWIGYYHKYVIVPYWTEKFYKKHNLKNPIIRYSEKDIKKMEKKYFSMVKNWIAPTEKELKKEWIDYFYRYIGRKYWVENFYKKYNLKSTRHYSKREIKEMEKKYFSLVKNWIAPWVKELKKEWIDYYYRRVISVYWIEKFYKKHNLKTPSGRYTKEEVKEMEKKYFSMVKDRVPPTLKELEDEWIDYFYRHVMKKYWLKEFYKKNNLKKPLWLRFSDEQKKEMEKKFLSFVKGRGWIAPDTDELEDKWLKTFYQYLQRTCWLKEYYKKHNIKKINLSFERQQKYKEERAEMEKKFLSMVKNWVPPSQVKLRKHWLMIFYNYLHRTNKLEDFYKEHNLKPRKAMCKRLSEKEKKEREKKYFSLVKNWIAPWMKEIKENWLKKFYSYLRDNGWIKKFYKKHNLIPPIGGWVKIPNKLSIKRKKKYLSLVKDWIPPTKEEIKENWLELYIFYIKKHYWLKKFYKKHDIKYMKKRK